MASLLAGITALSLAGTPGLETWDDGTPLPVTASDTASISISESASAPAGFDPLILTELGLTGVPFPVRAAIEGVVPPNQVDFSVSDTASLSGTEGPVDSNEISTSDVVQLTLVEVSALFNQIDTTDTTSLVLSETINIQASGTPDFPVTDTASLTLSESVALDVGLDVTDTASISATEDPGTVDVSTDTFDVTDTTSISVSEAAVLDIFAGVVAITADDVASLAVIDISSLVIGGPSNVAKIIIQMSAPRIVIERL